MRSRSRNSRKKSSHRSSRVCASSCCAHSEPEQNLCYHCTRESRNSKCSCCCRRLKCKPSNECNLKCQDKNTGVAKPLNVHLKLQLLNDRNQNKKSECLCAKYFQMLNACYGGPPLCQNLCGQVCGEDRQMREKTCFLKSMRNKCNFFKKSDPNIEQTRPSRSSTQQQRPSQIQRPIEHVDGETQTDEKLPKASEVYVENILSSNENGKMQNVTNKEHDDTMNQINSALNEITNTLQSIETKLKNPPNPKFKETENFHCSTPRSSVQPTIVSFFTKCIPPPPLLTLSKLSCYHNPSPTIPTFPTQKTGKTNLTCEEILRLFNFDGRMNFTPGTQTPDCNLMEGDVCPNETIFQINNNHKKL